MTKYPTRIECPICGHYENLIISKEATLKSLEDMNWKQKVRNAIKKLREGLFDEDGTANYSHERVQYGDRDGYRGYEQALDELKQELGIK